MFSFISGDSVGMAAEMICTIFTMIAAVVSFLFMGR